MDCHRSVTHFFYDWSLSSVESLKTKDQWDFYYNQKKRLLDALNGLSFDARAIKDTIQRTVSLRAFNRGALGLLPEDVRTGAATNRVDFIKSQCGQPVDLFTDRSFNVQIIYLMNKHKLWERYGLSLNDCLNMRTAQWNELIKTVEQLTLQRSLSSTEIIAATLNRLEQVFTQFITPAKTKGKGKK